MARYCPKCDSYVRRLQVDADYRLRCPRCQRIWTTSPRPIPRPFVVYSRPQARGQRLQAIGQRDGWRCHLCGGAIDPDLAGDQWLQHPLEATVDHVIPRAHGGGRRNAANLRLAHRCCNMLRGTDPL